MNMDAKEYIEKEIQKITKFLNRVPEYAGKLKPCITFNEEFYVSNTRDDSFNIKLFGYKLGAKKPHVFISLDNVDCMNSYKGDKLYNKKGIQDCVFFLKQVSVYSSRGALKGRIYQIYSAPDWVKWQEQIQVHQRREKQKEVDKENKRNKRVDEIVDFIIKDIQRIIPW